jgi:hypothetical protein
MATKHWVTAALHSLNESLSPLPHEVNELDWKAGLSDNKERLAEHLMAFGNHSDGAGGPQRYDGRDMRTVYAGMNISEQELIATIDDFVAAMQGQGVGATEVNEVVAILYSLKGEVLRV